MKFGVYKKALIGASLLAVLIFLFPTLFGEGYEKIKLADNHPEKYLENTLLHGFEDNKWILLAFVVATMMFKVFVATGLTLGSGGNGGNFAPSLFIGSYLGFVLAIL